MVTTERLTAEQAQTALPPLIEILQDAVESGASVGFVLPISEETARDYWLKVLEDVAHGSRWLLIATQEGQVAGTVQLELAAKQNAQHRAEVQKLLVHRRFRQQGIGRALMATLEDQARIAGRTLLMLDTQTGEVAEQLYRKIGWVPMGIVPNHAQGTDGVLTDTTFFYRLL